MSPPSKKFKLNSETSPEIFLLGILSDEADLRLAWLINQHLGLHLSRTAPFLYLSKKISNTQEFPCYRDDEGESPAWLIRNLSKEGMKLADYKEFDYLLATLADSQDWLETMRSLEQIRAVYQIDSTPIEKMALP